MDWKNKFHSIVKETEENLAKAKEKLSGKRRSTLDKKPSQGFGKPKKAVSDISGVAFPEPSAKTGVPSLSEDPKSSLTMSAASAIQVLHMQEQIDSQNRTIEKLQSLVRNLDSEREYYKDQISQLKDEVDSLTERTSGQMALAQFQKKHASNVKTEVMREIEKLKLSLQLQSRESDRLKGLLSPRPDQDLWTVKENLTDSLESVRHELSLMNTRIDRMETQIARSSLDTRTAELTQDRLSRSLTSTRSPRLYTPLSRTSPDRNGLDVLQLKQTINSVKSKLDSLESRLESGQGAMNLSSPVLDNLNSPREFRHYTALHSSDNLRPYSPPFKSRYGLDSTNLAEDQSMHNLSDLSDLSELSDVDVDDELDDLIIGTADYSPRRGGSKSLYKSSLRYKGKVDFDLSDLDLSDVENVDIDTDSLDLNN